MFNPSEHLMNIGTDKKPRMYLETKYRLVWLREQHPEATIETEILQLDLDREVTAEVSEWNNNTGRMEKVTKRGQGLVIFKATIQLPNGAIGTGTKMQNGAEFSEWLEKAETGAIGRALSSLGYGTAATDEMSEGEGRVVDAPVDRKPSYDPNKPCTESQLTTIAKLYRDLGQEPMDCSGMNFGDCAALLKELQARLQTKRKAS
ncbi:MAG TPA: hypothetical protein VHV10_20590 [Ktedonobacteraceae bacterium]|jgi:hypothetical protein|nr:hypothetical protein [Ktedonobacteraceae bacterium]